MLGLTSGGFAVRLITMRAIPILALAALLGGPALAAKGVAFKVASVDGGTLTVGGKEVLVGAELPEGAVVRLDKGDAVLELGDEGWLQLTGPAEVKFGDRRADIKIGKLLSVLPKLRRGFTASTPIAVAAVRGTKFFVEARQDGRTYLCLCEGALEVAGAKGLGYRKTLRSKNHASYIFSKIGKRLDRGPWRMENH